MSFLTRSFISLLCFLSVFLVMIQPSLADLESCQSLFRCGNITAGYPFWGGDRLQFCGHPLLELECENDTPTFMIAGVRYNVFNIDQKKQVLKIAGQGYSEGFCPQNNITFDTEIFEIANGYEMFKLTYGCPTTSGKFTCFMKDITGYTDGFLQFTGSFTSPDCNTSVNVPISKSSLAAKSNKMDLEGALKGGFEMKWKLSGCDENCSSCGYDPVSSKGVCYSTAAQKSEESSPLKKRNIYIGIAASGMMVILVIPAILYVSVGRFWEKTTEDDRNVEGFIRNYGSLAPKRYNYSTVKRMTESFKYKLGRGGYGDVYKGKLPDGRPVAVKVLKNSKGKGEEFINEVASISRTSHVNIVAFLGFCYEKKKRALIYEFMPNGSLDRFIYHQESSNTNTNRKLEWRTMYQIAVGIARGLQYLHQGCNIRIVHFDIKPHNILLDEDFCPKISDFGLAKQSKNKESIISMLEARGTVGYIAPEVFCRSIGQVSHKSDVYSYGMMILEMVVGRKNADVKVSRSSEIYFPNSIYKLVEPGNDFQLDGVVTQEDKEMAKRMILVSLWCIQTNPSDRPSISKAVEMLEGSIEILQIPPKPSVSSPRRSAKSSSPTSLSTVSESLEESCV